MNRSAIILLHASYWLAYFALAAIAVLAISQTVDITPADVEFYKGVIVGIGIAPAIFTFYIFYFLLFPRYLQQRKITQAVISGILVSLASFLVGAFTLSFTANMGWSCYAESNYVAILIVSFLSFLHGVAAFIIRGFITWYQEIKWKEELQQKNHEMELAVIKSQLDPHFLFNTLNNIDILIVKNPAQASEYLNKLSDIMRFMLFETKTQKIPLAQEIEYIHKYVELQKIRTANEEYVNFTVNGNPENTAIAPLVFIPFIENAFKHTNNKKLKDAITIEINVSDTSVSMRCNNKIDPTRSSIVERNGLGHELISKRLRLLYPDLHALDIKREEDSYQVFLKIDHETV
ncbi:MAG: sensor histidine kinase [Saprospiraceae bacterium]